MNIGLVSQALPYLPSRGGFRLYGGNLIRHLSRRHRIDLVAMLIEDDEAHLDWAKEYCASIRTIRVSRSGKLLAPLSAITAHLWGRPLQQRRAMARTLDQVWRNWDVMHVEGGYAGGIVPDLAIAKILSLHDSWTLRCAEMLRCAQSVKEKLYYQLLSLHEPRFERLVYPRFERVTVVAPPDVTEVQRTVPDCQVDLIPYGTDTGYFHPVDVPKEKHTLVFHSHLGYAPNIEAALEFANDILPLVRQRVPDAVFHLVGANPDPKVTELASRPGIRISANLPDLRPAVCAGQVYVCAIRHGTGLKSKMLEAMGMRMPIVGYPGATVGLTVEHGVHVMEANDARQFAAYVVDLLENPEKADRMAQAGRTLVEEEYSWESRAQAYEALYERVIEERRSRTHTRPVTLRAVARAER
jgi:glycosyltransferase involved in cell wall biosynthesis